MQKVYLDYKYFETMVTFWRAEKVKAEAAGDEMRALTARCYVDAAQCALVSHGLPMVPREDVTNEETETKEV